MCRWLAVASLSIVFIQTNGGQDWTLWQQFLAYFENVETPSNYRSNSINSLVGNSLKVITRLVLMPIDLAPILINGLKLAILAWLMLRLIQREHIYNKMPRSTASGKADSWSTTYRVYGHTMDTVTLSLLISPSVWEHHLVVAIPIAIWALATRRKDQFLLVAIGTFLIFCVPIYDIFPFSYNRLVGLLMLLYLTSPEKTQKFFLQKREPQLKTD
jgi:hypothetical protein